MEVLHTMMGPYTGVTKVDDFLPMPRNVVIIPESKVEHPKCPKCKHYSYPEKISRELKVRDEKRKKLEESWGEGDGPLPEEKPHPLGGINTFALNKAFCPVFTPAVADLGYFVPVWQEAFCSSCGEKWVIRAAIGRRVEG